MLREETIHPCQCSSAPQALLSRGFFPCSPVAPSLAVDIKLLEFARLQFLHLVLNTTGWCEAMESFLNRLSSKPTTRVCILLCWFFPCYLAKLSIRIAYGADLAEEQICEYSVTYLSYSGFPNAANLALVLIWSRFEILFAHNEQHWKVGERRHDLLQMGSGKWRCGIERKQTRKLSSSCPSHKQLR